MVSWAEGWDVHSHHPTTARFLVPVGNSVHMHWVSSLLLRYELCVKSYKLGPSGGTRKRQEKASSGQEPSSPSLRSQTAGAHCAGWLWLHHALLQGSAICWAARWLRAFPPGFFFTPCGLFTSSGARCT